MLGCGSSTMAVPELTAPSEAAAVFTLAMEVGDGDIDMLEHASNLAYVRWVQDVAVAHSEAVGLDFAAYRQLGAVFVVRRHEIDYLRPVLRGERLELRTWIATVFAAKCHRATDVIRVADGQTVARAVTTWGFIELATGRPRRIPDSVRAAFGQKLLGR